MSCCHITFLHRNEDFFVLMPLNKNFDLALQVYLSFRVSEIMFLINWFLIKKGVSNYNAKWDQKNVRLFWNAFSEIKKPKDIKEAVVEDEHLERANEGSYLKVVGLWPNEISE